MSFALPDKWLAAVDCVEVGSATWSFAANALDPLDMEGLAAEDGLALRRPVAACLDLATKLLIAECLGREEELAEVERCLDDPRGGDSSKSSRLYFSALLRDVERLAGVYNTHSKYVE